jgi:hypothetical protein
MEESEQKRFLTKLSLAFVGCLVVFGTGILLFLTESWSSIEPQLAMFGAVIWIGSIICVWLFGLLFSFELAPHLGKRLSSRYGESVLYRGSQVVVIGSLVIALVVGLGFPTQTVVQLTEVEETTVPSEVSVTEYDDLSTEEQASFNTAVQNSEFNPVELHMFNYIQNGDTVYQISLVSGTADYILSTSISLIVLGVTGFGFGINLYAPISTGKTPDSAARELLNPSA